MKLDAKLISIIVLIQVIVAALVFTLTRAYYQEDTSVVSTPAEPLPSIFPANTSPQMSGGFPGFPEASESLVMPSSNDPMQINQQGHDAFNKKDYETAAKLYQRVIDLAPDRAGTYNNLGLTLHYIDRSDEALEVLKKGIALQPDVQRIWLTLGFVQSGVGNYPDAKRSLQRAVELGPETAQGKSAAEMLDKLP